MKYKLPMIIGNMFILLIILMISVNINKKLINQEIDKKSELIKNISFEPYSNENGLIVLVNIQDNENGIDTITYKGKDGKEVVVNANKKNKVAIDYKIENDGEYTFIAYNGIGEKIEKTLVIDSINKKNDTLGSLIDIQINPITDDRRTVATKANITIDYKYGLGNNYYKIGNSKVWNDYNNEFQIDSYTILDGNWQESDNKTITIYAKNEDIAKNKITITKQTTELDLDMPNDSTITILHSDPYPKLTEYGMKLYNEVEIQYDNRDDITNYYSLNSGYTWIEYTGKISGDSDFCIYTKSVKNNSGLERVTIKYVQPSANDALRSQAYDKNADTYAEAGITYLRVYLDNSIRGKKVNLILNMYGTNGQYGSKVEFYHTDGTKTTLLSRMAGRWLYSDSNYDIPENAEYIAFGGSSTMRVHEITVGNDPIISERKIYPKLTEHGIEVGYCMTSISYFYTSVQKQYKINDGEWKDYENKEIRIEIGDILYARSIDKNGTVSRKTSYTASLPLDAVGPQAYDKNTSTYENLPSSGTSKVYLDDSIRGKKVHLILNMQGNNNLYIYEIYEGNSINNY